MAERLFMERTKIKSQRGAFLIGTLIFVVLLSIILLAVASLVTNQSRHQSIYAEERKAFYAAESGLELSLADLNAGGNGALEDVTIGEAFVNTTVEGDSVITSTANTYRGHSRLKIDIQLRNLPEAFYYVVSSFNPDKKLEFNGSHTPYISGKIFSYTTDKVKLDKDYDIDEANTTLTVPEGTKVENKGPYTIEINYFPAGTTPLEWPVLNTTYYDNYINNVYGYAEYPEHEIETDVDLTTLPDGVLYVYDEDIKIKEGVTITGPGKIVSTKKVVADKHVTIGPNVQIIAAKDVEIKEFSQVMGMESILYSSEKVKIKHQETDVYGSIISPKKVEIDPESEFVKRGAIYGIIYCGTGDKAKIKHSLIYGSVVAYTYDSEEVHCTYIVWDESYLPKIAPPGFTPPDDSVYVAIGNWRIER